MFLTLAPSYSKPKQIFQYPLRNARIIELHRALPAIGAWNYLPFHWLHEQVVIATAGTFRLVIIQVLRLRSAPHAPHFKAGRCRLCELHQYGLVTTATLRAVCFSVQTKYPGLFGLVVYRLSLPKTPSDSNSNNLRQVPSSAKSAMIPAFWSSRCSGSI